VTVKPAPPFSVLGGFLGAGKTTLLNRLLADSAAPRCAVLVNDFGSIAVDAALIDARNSAAIAMQNGCVCCSIGGDLARGIATALDLAPPPQGIVLEASGVALPGRLAQVARVSPELTPGRVFVLADASQVRAQLRDAWIADTVDAQLRAADHIAVSKSDAASPAAQAEVIDFLAREYPAASLSTTDEVQWRDLLAVDGVAANASVARVDSDASTTAHARFAARTLRADAPVDLQRLADWLKRQPRVYRLKGWAIDGDGKTKLLQSTGAELTITDTAPITDLKGLLAIIIGHPALPPAARILNAIKKPATA